MDKSDIKKNHLHFTEKHEIYRREICGYDENSFEEKYYLKLVCKKCNIFFEKNERDDKTFEECLIDYLYELFISVGR